MSLAVSHSCTSPLSVPTDRWVPHLCQATLHTLSPSRKSHSLVICMQACRSQAPQKLQPASGRPTSTGPCPSKCNWRGTMRCTLHTGMQGCRGVPATRLCRACGPEVDAGAQADCEHVLGRPVHQIQVEVVLQLWRIQNLGCGRATPGITPLFGYTISCHHCRGIKGCSKQSAHVRVKQGSAPASAALPAVVTWNGELGMFRWACLQAAPAAGSVLKTDASAAPAELAVAPGRKRSTLLAGLHARVKGVQQVVKMRGPT